MTSIRETHSVKPLDEAIVQTLKERHGLPPNEKIVYWTDPILLATPVESAKVHQSSR